MKLDPGIHIDMHSVLFFKPGVTAALVLVELGWWVDWVVFGGLAAAASCGCS